MPSNETKLEPYPLPVHGAIKMPCTHALLALSLGIIFQVMSFTFPLGWNFLPLLMGMLFLIGGSLALFTESSFTIDEEKLERKTWYKTYYFKWEEIAELKLLEVSLVKRLDFMGSQKPSLGKRILNPGAPVSSIPLNYVKGLDADRLLVTVQTILSNKLNMEETERAIVADPDKIKRKQIKIQFVPFLTGNFILAAGGVMFFIVCKEIFDLTLDTALILLACIIQPVLCLIVGLILGIWVRHWPTFEILMTVMVCFMGNLNKLIGGEIESAGWGWLGLILSIAVSIGFLSGGACLGKKLQNKRNNKVA